MKITNKSTETYKEIILDGRLDTTTVSDNEQLIMAEVTDEHQNYLMDCSKISYISSSGLRVFLKLQKLTALKKYSLVLHSMPEHIYEIFKMCNFTTIFTIVDSKEDGIKEIG